MHKKLIRNNKLARESTEANCENRVGLKGSSKRLWKCLESSRNDRQVICKTRQSIWEAVPANEYTLYARADGN